MPNITGHYRKSLTVKLVRAKIEQHYRLDSGTLDTKEFRRPLREAIMTAAKAKNEDNQKRKRGEATDASACVARFASVDGEMVKIVTANRGTKPSSHQKGRKLETKEFKSTEFVESSDEVEDASINVGTSTSHSSRKRNTITVSEDEDIDKSMEVGCDNEMRAGGGKARDLKNKNRFSSHKETKRSKKAKIDTDEPLKRVKSKGKQMEELNKDEGTIKRLKSLVLACGVRKTWSKVFHDCDLPSQQIKRLKDVLTELGMTGRYSLEQAKRVRARRELAQELEDVRSFELSVTREGKQTKSPQDDDDDDDDDDGDTIPVKRKRTALQSIAAFLEQSDDD